MNCPRTQSLLKKINVGNVPVYVSELCGGVFLENQSLKDFESAEGKRGKALTKHLEQFHIELMNEAERVKCPFCKDTIMLRRFYSPLHVVEIDECPECGGIWLDTGELAKLQSLMLNERDRAMLRAQLMEDNRPSIIEGLPHLRDRWILRSDKIDNLLSLTTFFY